MATHHSPPTAREANSELAKVKAAQEMDSASGNFRVQDVQDVEYVETERPAAMLPENW